MPFIKVRLLTNGLSVFFSSIENDDEEVFYETAEDALDAISAFMKEDWHQYYHIFKESV